VRASDDVAAMSAGTSLRTNVTTLRRALINASQGTSLLQVADGALSQVTDILQRQKAIAVQASGGTLTSSERSFLNQEFQNLTQEIDRISGSTNFNGVKLINGALSESAGVSSNSTTGARASASINFSANIFAGSAMVLNGVTVTQGGATYAIGTGITDTLDNLVTYLNSQTGALADATYARSGNALVITAKAGGNMGETYRIDNNMANSTSFSATGAAAGARIATVSGNVDRRLTNTVSGITAANTNVASVVAAAATAGSFTAGAAGTFQISGNTGAAANLTAGALVAGTTLEGLVAQINGNSAASGVTARIGGYSGNYSIIFERGYNNANETTVAFATAGAAFGALTIGGVDNHSTAYLQGGTDAGLSAGRTTVSGTVGNSLVTSQNQTAAKTTIVFPDIADSDLLTAANFGTTTKFLDFATNTDNIRFAFVNQTPSTAAGGTEVQVGATLTDTLDNLVKSFNTYSAYAGNEYSLKQIEARREGNSVVFERKDVGNVNNPNATALTVTAPLVTGISTLGSFANGSSTGGVNTSGVTNKDFIGTVQGFSATYTGTANRVNMSITVGSNTYTALNVTTNPAANTTVRFSSQDGGGYFDVEMASGQGATVGTQADANSLNDRFNAAFASLNFNQKRTVSSYTGNAPILTNGVVTGSLIGSSVEMKLSDFSDVKVEKIAVNAPAGSNANGSIAITVNGETFNSIPTLGKKLGANGVFKLTSAVDANRTIEFRTGATGIDFSTAEKAAAFETALSEAFGVGEGSAALNFQVGNETSDALAVSIGNVDTDTLFKGATVDVLTQASAIAAGDAIDAAIKTVTSVRAEVGALQSRFDFASANIESSIQNQDAARGVLLDTDVAAEATSYATAQVQLQAGISVLAQANQLPQNLLKLIG
jgi:flagellin